MRMVCCAVMAALGAACSEPISIEWKRQLQSPSVSSPLISESFIAVGHELGVSVLESDGTPRCVFPTHRDVISAPQTDGQRIFFGSTNYIFYAIDTQCSEVWRFPTSDRIKSDPLVNGKMVYVSSYDGHLYALNTATGEQLWKFPPSPSPKIDAQPAVVDKPKGRRRAAAPRSQRKKRHTPPSPETPVPSSPPPKAITVGDFSYSSPVIAEDTIYVGNLDHNLYAIDAKHGTMRGRFKTDGPVTSTPLVESGVLFFGSNDGSVYAIDLVTNKRLWTFRTQDWVNSSPQVADEILYIGSNDRHIYAIETRSGRLKWKFETEGPAIAIPALYKNLVIGAGGSGDGTLYALQRVDGSLFWHFRTGGKIESDPVIIGDTMFVSSADENLYKFHFKRTMPK